MHGPEKNNQPDMAPRLYQFKIIFMLDLSENHLKHAF